MPESTHFNGVSVGQLISEGARNPSTDALPRPLWREFPGVLHKIQIPGPSLDWLTQSLWGGAEGSARDQACCGRGEVGGVGWEEPRVGGAKGGRSEVGGAEWEEQGGRGVVGGARWRPAFGAGALSLPSCFLPFSC